jgi:hypothetical protein
VWGEAKKLSEAARLWARGQLRLDTGSAVASEAEESVSDALAAFGLMAEGPLEIDEPFYLWPENEPTFKLWTQVQTQWQVAGDGGGFTGLNYSGVQACMNLYGIRGKQRTELFVGLQVMERAALHAWQEKKRAGA